MRNLIWLSGGSRAVAAGLATVSAVLAVGAVPVSAQPGNGAVQAVIRYTEYGLPHIRAHSLVGLGYGYGYAAAVDNICSLADIYLTVDAERSRFLGAAAPANSDLGLARNSLNSDFYFQQINDSGVVERLVAQPPPLGPEPGVAELIRGYVAGYNRYLRDTGSDGITDPACRGAAWVRPITPIQVYRHMRALATVSASGVVIDGIVEARPPEAAAEAEAVEPVAETAARLVAAVNASHGQGLGSNAIATGRDGTTAGGSVLLGNPHYPWRGSRRFWQSHLTIPGHLDVAGASLLGIPGIMIGHNADVAWSHTVSTAATFGLYEVPLVSGVPTEYLVDSVPERMTSRQVRVVVRQPDGSFATVERTLWSTRYGPVISAGPGVRLPWADTAYSLRDPNGTNLRMLNSWLGLNRARDTGDVVATLSRTQGVPWVNTIAADRQGSVVFSDIQVVPNVTNQLAATCSTALGSVVFPLSGISILDGGRAACAWGADPDAVEPGLLGPAQLPTLIRGDYVVNSNNSAWLTNPQAPLTGYPRVAGSVGTVLSTRAQEALLSVQRRLAGTDGQSGTGFSAESMRRMLFVNRSRTAELALPDTRRMCASFEGGRAPASTGPVDVVVGCTALAGWSGDYRLDSRGSLLFERFVARLAGVPGGPWRVPFDVRDPLNTPNTLNVELPVVQRAFGDAAVELRTAGIPQDAPLGRYQYVIRDDERIPIHGGPHNLGVLNVVTPVWDPANGNTEVRHGSSFIQVVEFDGCRDPEVYTLLTYSQSGDPTSPHHADQTALFSSGQWVRERFSQQDISRSPQLRVQVLVE